MAVVDAATLDEYSRINKTASGDILNMYLNYGGSEGDYQDDPGLDPDYQSDTPHLDSVYGGMVAKDAMQSTLAGVAKGRVTRGLISGLMFGQMPSVSAVLDPVGISSGFALGVPGGITRGLLGLNDPSSKAGGFAGGMLGSLLGGPVGGMMGSMLGNFAGAGLGDLLGIRDEEVYRDFLEDEYGWLRAQQLYSMETNPGMRAYRETLERDYRTADINEPLQYDTSGIAPDFIGPNVVSDSLAYDGYNLNFDSDVGSLDGYGDFDLGDIDTGGFDTGFGFGSDTDTAFGGYDDSDTDTAFGGYDDGDDGGFGGWW